MATESENYKFQKPDENEYYDVGVQNKNWDILDKVLSAHEGNKENPHNVTPEQIGAATPEYVDKQIALVTETGIPKLMVYPLSVTATEDNQTTFPIDLSTFDVDTDTVLVQSGRTMLFPNQDFTVNGSTVVLNEGVPSGRTIGIYVFKNVPLGEDGSVSGKVINPNSLPLDRLAEMPSAEQVGALPIIDAKNADYDMDVILTTPDTNAFYITNSETLNTPYKKGVTLANNCTIYSYTDSGNYGYQIAFLAGGIPLMRILDSGNISDWSTGSLPLTGGMLSDNLYIDRGSAYAYNLLFTLYKASVEIRSVNKADGTYSALILFNDTTTVGEHIAYRKSSDESKSYKLFGEHNKPSGSYTGNGSSTSRAIETGGLSDCIIISNVDKGAVVTPCGAIGFTTSGVEVIPYLQAHFVNGVLTLATTSEIVNKSGNTYYYKCL